MQTEDGKYPTLGEAYRSALSAVEMFYDAASNEEANWTGWGEQIVPFSAEMRRVKAKQAFDAIRDAGAPLAGAAMSANPNLATSHQLLRRAVAIEHEAETYASVGMYRTSGDMKRAAGDLRKLAKEASAHMGRMGE